MKQLWRSTLCLFVLFFSFTFLSLNKVNAEVYFAKVIFVGDWSSGKSSLIGAYYGEQFQEYRGHTWNFESRLKRFNYKGDTIILRFWDTGGEEKGGYRNVVEKFFKDSKIAFIVVDLEKDIYTLKDLQKSSEVWINKIREASPGCGEIIIGTKKDKIPRQTLLRHTDFIKQSAEYAECPWAVVSACDSTNVQQELDRCLKEVLDKIGVSGLGVEDNQPELVVIPPPPAEKKGLCD